MTYEEARKIYLEGRLASSPYDAQLLAELGPAPSFWFGGQPPEPAPDKRGPNVLNFGEWRSRKRPRPSPIRWERRWSFWRRDPVSRPP